MATDYSSVDSFVAAYLANCESQAQTQQQGQNAHGLPFAGANGLQPAFQQVIGVAGQVHSMGGVHLKYEQGAGDVYMQPYDQTAHQMCMNHVAQQRDWQLQQQQQQQLELLLQQQQQQQQQQHHAQQQAQQHQQQVLAAAVEVQGAGSGGRPATPKSSSWPGSSSSKQLEQPEASATTGKRSSRSKTNSRGRSSRQEQDAAAAQQAVTTDMDRSFAEHNLVHSMSAPPQPSDPAAAAAAFAAAQVGGPHSFPAYGQAGPLHDQPGNLAGVLMMQQQAEAARLQQAASAHAMQMQPSALQEEDEPDMSHLTVMQRYHARRKLAVQRMEREVEEKIAQLALLEQENKQLKWQAHILENMLLDMDKQVELMSSGELPDASQWLTLLGIGTNAAAGSSGRIARTLHKMLEGAAATDITGWTAADCRRKWLTYLEQLRPLVEEAEAAQAASRSAQATSSDQQDSSAQQMQQRPRRAAAAAAVAVIKQEAADVLGVPVLPVCPVAGNIPDLPAPQAHAGYGSNQSSSKTSGSSPKVQATAVAAGCTGADSSEPMQGVQHVDNDGSKPSVAPAVSDHSGGSCTGSEVSHGPNVDGVPGAVLSKIEHLVLTNFYWLLAIMTRNPVLTYEFISMDLLEGTTPVPPQSHEVWGKAVERIEMTLEQQHESCTCLQVARRCMAKVMEERAEITAAMQPCVGSYSTVPDAQAWMSHGLVAQNQADATVDRMRANVRKESVVRNLVGFYCINVVSLHQLAQLSVACSPWFCMAWRIAGAVEEKVNRQLAGKAAMQQQGTGHTTRSSARLAAQR